MSQEKQRSLPPVDTGALRADIRYEVAPDENAVYIGNTEEIPYAKYQEFGTSKMKAHPYLKPAATRSTGKNTNASGGTNRHSRTRQKQ